MRVPLGRGWWSLGVAVLLATGLVMGVTTPTHAQPPPPPEGTPPPPTAPPPQVETAPPLPGPEYVWVPGHWAWRPWLNRYVWIPGFYHVPAAPTHVWMPGHWVWHPVLRQYTWVEGHWRYR